MKILAINSLDERYGSTYRFRKLKDALRAFVLDTIYVESNCDVSENEISVKQSDGITGYISGTFKRTLLSLKMDYDVLIVQKFIPLTLSCILAAKMRGKKVIVDWDDLDTYLQNSLFRKYITAFCEWIGPKLPDMITTHSLVIGEIAKSKTDKPVILINQGVDFSLFDPSFFSKQSIKKKLGIEDKKVLGHLCTLTQGGAADLGLILRAFDDVAKVEKNLLLLIVGGGPKEKDVNDEIEKLGLSDKVMITGLLDQKDVPGYVSAMDLSLIYMRDNPGNRARVSFKVLESLAMDKPVVGHLVGETSKRFGKHVIETGDDIKNFENAILENLNRKEHSSPRDELVKDYSWDNISKRYVEEIRKALD